MTEWWLIPATKITYLGLPPATVLALSALRVGAKWRERGTRWGDRQFCDKCVLMRMYA